MTDADDLPAPAIASALVDADSGIRPRRDAVAAGLVVLCVSVLGVAVLYYFARQWQVEAVRGELLQTARIAATRVDVAAHDALTDPAQELGPVYRRALAPLVDVLHASDDLAYLYTGRLDADGRVRFVLDTATVAPPDGDTTPAGHLLQEYDGADRDFRRALVLQIATINAAPQTDEFGDFLSAYAPFYDDAGRLAGVVGADMRLQAYQARVARVSRIATTSGLAMLAVAALTSLIVFRLRSIAAEAAARDRQALADLAAARDAVEESGRAKSAFLAMMSHELRTPLTAIVGYSELIHEELTGRGLSQHAADIDRVRTAGLHLSAVIADILDFSKIDAGRLRLTPAATDLAALLRDVEQHLRPAADAKGLTMQVSCPEVTAWLDPVRLRQVLVNLVANGIKFTESGGVTVRVSAAAGDARRVVCTVHDTGVGIPADKRGRLFKPFSQVDSSMTRRASGSGLGLVISHRLVEAMGGRLTVRSRLGRGSAFRVSLPGVLQTTRQAA